MRIFFYKFWEISISLECLLRISDFLVQKIDTTLPCHGGFYQFYSCPIRYHNKPGLSIDPTAELSLWQLGRERERIQVAIPQQCSRKLIKISQIHRWKNPTVMEKKFLKSELANALRPCKLFPLRTNKQKRRKTIFN